jgi:hypothetical protein
MLNGREFETTGPFPNPAARTRERRSRQHDHRLVNARNTHGRGNYAERWDGTDGLFAFERQGSALVLLSNRGDAGFDSRTLVNLGFRPGTLLIELTGNAADNIVNPDRGGHRDVPEVIRVFEEGGAAKANVRFQRPGTMSNSGQFHFHGKGFLVYGLPTPKSDNGIELTNVAEVLPGSDQNQSGGKPKSVLSAAILDVRLRTQAVRLLGSNDLRDVDADGDEALLRIDGGLDLNGNNTVDFKTPGSTEYGFERFVTKRNPLIGNHDVHAPRGDGEFRQVIDAKRLSEGIHFITVRAYRHQPAGSPAVFSEFKKVIYIDRLPPVSEFDSFRPVEGNATETEVLIRSTDQTADTVHVFANLPASMTEAQILADVNAGKRRLELVDRALFRGRLQGLPRGTNTLTILKFCI